MIRRLLPCLILLVAVASLGACSRTSAFTPTGGERIDATGQAVRHKWEPMGLARRDAIDLATTQARHSLWYALMARTIAWPDASRGAGTLAQLAVMDPAFASRLRGLIADIEPRVLNETSDGLVTVGLSAPMGRIEALAVTHGARLQPIALAPTRMGRIPAVAGD